MNVVFEGNVYDKMVWSHNTSGSPSFHDGPLEGSNYVDFHSKAIGSQKLPSKLVSPPPPPPLVWLLWPRFPWRMIQKKELDLTSSCFMCVQDKELFVWLRLFGSCSILWRFVGFNRGKLNRFSRVGNKKVMNKSWVLAFAR